MDLKGLSRAEVDERIARGQVNNTSDVKTKSVKQIVMEHSVTLFNILNLILALAVILVGSFRNAIFMGTVIANALIGIIQEIRSKKMVDRLSLMIATKAQVVRSGVLTEIDIEDIVKDDVLHFKRGSQIPVDARVMAGTLSVNESLVTGEADIISKTEGDELISGSFVAGGDAYAKVLRVGKDCFAAGISREAKTVKKAESEIMRTLDRIVRIISFVLVPMGLFLFMNQLSLEGAGFKSAVVSTAAALVTMIPEGLMLLTSSVMAVAVIRLSRKNVLVQQMYCIETLARVDVICLDKTGTITSGKMHVVDNVPFMGTTREQADEGFRRMAAVSRDEGATPDAIRECFGVTPGIKAKRIIDFSSDKKYSGAEFDDKTYVMGAGEMIFGDDYHELEDLIRERIGMNRVIILAETSESFGPDGELPGMLRPVAALLIQDEIRKEAGDTIRYFTEQGVSVKVISGDGVETVSHIAAAAGVPSADKAVDARTLTSDEKIAEAMADMTVFGRVTPAQKRQFVRELQRQGHTVAMTGDGVNDVLAMKESDCSIAMASGSEAARNTAQLVLTTDDFSSMPKVVAEGRRSINNIQRSSSLFLTKTIFAILNSILFALATLQYPFEPIQMSYINTLTVGIPSFILALQPNRERVTGNFFLNIATRAVGGGITMFAGLLLVYAAGGIFGLDHQAVSTLAVLGTAGILVFILLRISIPFDWVRSILLGLVVTGLVFCGWWLHDLLGFSDLSLKLGLIFLAITVINATIFFLLFNECEKFRAYMNRKYPEDLLKEKRRRKMDKKAKKAAARLAYSEKRRSEYTKESKGYRGLVKFIAAPISAIGRLIRRKK